MSIIDIKDLRSIRKKHKNEKIVFCSGSFDLIHAGHVMFLEDCKKRGDILVVSVGSDFNLSLRKGKDRPVLNEYVRLKMIDSFKPVDYAVREQDALDTDVLGVLPRVFEELKPDLYVINDDAFDIPRRRELINGFCAQLVVLERKCPPEFENISTTKIIEKIKKG